MGYNDVILVWFPVESSDFDYDTIAEIIDGRMQYYLEPIYDGEEWGYEEPSEHELLSLGVRPDIAIAVQATLFQE